MEVGGEEKKGTKGEGTGREGQTKWLDEMTNGQTEEGTQRRTNVRWEISGRWRDTGWRGKVGERDSWGEREMSRGEGRKGEGYRYICFIIPFIIYICFTLLSLLQYSCLYKWCKRRRLHNGEGKEINFRVK